MVTGINYTYCGDNSAMHVNVKSLWYTLESNTMSYGNYNSAEKNEEDKKYLRYTKFLEDQCFRKI